MPDDPESRGPSPGPGREPPPPPEVRRPPSRPGAVPAAAAAPGEAKTLSTGIRRLELSRLKLYDVDTEHGTLMVRQGKGRKDRLVPLGERACRWIDRDLAEVRPQLVIEPDHGMLFVTDYGEPFEKNRLGDMVKRYMRLAGFENGACHAFRHAMATHMLEAGCDIRYIQAILGHSELSTTEIYTQVSIGKLKEIHAATHPARLARASERHEPPRSESRAPR